MAQPDPVLEPVDDDGVAATTVGIVIWAVAAVACLLGREQLAERDAQWWVWTCLAGALYGVAMLVFMRRRAQAYRAHREGAEPSGPGGR
jgi:hypothetical protein